MKILVLNLGSSSIKFKLFEMGDKSVIASGLVEKIGEKSSYAKLKAEKTKEIFESTEAIKDHAQGLEVMENLFKKSGIMSDFEELGGIGHRVVHGGNRYFKPTLVTEKVIQDIEDIIPLAPLHNPAHAIGIRSVMKKAPNVKNVVVFDTAFHQTMPKSSYMYALPYEYCEKYKIRKYGAHGTSHEYVSKAGAKFMGIDINNFNCITLHLGNGASASAIKGGKCFDTSMGLTPLEGLMMGTRCGDIDPAVLPYLKRIANIEVEEMDIIMNKKSGLYGICGTNDMRDVEEKMKTDEKTKLAFDMFCYRIKKYVGAYYAALGKVDAIIFTAGIGENDDLAREAICENMQNLGIAIDKEKNSIRSGEIRDISTKDAKVRTLIVPTNEEFAIASATLELVK
ncbi:acetate kinase [Campylobacter sp. RM12327]|uniref:acetate kinase n=1 Tax=Campylobacter sputorum TaxID=206 RepID=UPI000B79A3A4|nr:MULTISPECIES: acetate kinase [Campylobacter]ASM40327.1 acetate kinase [Campylobacter sputorum]MBE7357404.1 acetate kinase [Campylobacter sp. RM11302]MBF6668714.1 acetate kinase [Campylobacter sp. RM12327]MBF6675283.1 acetate kinase [Campylobacter sp. RM13538]MBF6676895.1 acetate kinase [Campylobacter sp. RM12321]